MVDTVTVLKAARDLSRAKTPRALAEMLARYPVLVSPDTDAILTQAIQKAINERSSQVICVLLPTRAFLAEYAADRQCAFLEWAKTLPLPLACPLPELSQPASNHRQLPQRVNKARLVLRQLRSPTEPILWATVNYILGEALSQVSEGDRAANLNEAVHHLEEALQIWQTDKSTGQWRETLIALDKSWEEYALLDPANHIDKAIAFYRRTLQTMSVQEPFERALLLHTLAGLYCRHPGGKRAENIEQGIEHYKEAATIREQDKQQDLNHWIITYIGLSNAYIERVYGGRADNIELAIEGYEAVLKVISGPQSKQWAEAQYNLAVAYRIRLRGDRSANIDKAIEYAHIALCVYTEEAYPTHWAMVQNELATLYSQRRDGNREENLESAIGYYQAALKVHTCQAFPVQWARTQNNLGNAYSDRIRGNPIQNREEAIRYYNLGLEVHTREKYPREWADIQNNLGTVYAELRKDELAIECYRSALEVRTVQTLPEGTRQTASNWGHLHFRHQEWEQAHAVFALALEAAEIMYRASFTETGKQVEVAQSADLYRYAAFSTARSSDATQALLILEQGKTRLLAEVLRLRVPRPPVVPDDLWKAFERAGSEVRAIQSGDNILVDQEPDRIFAHATQEQIAQQAWQALENAIGQVRAYDPLFLKEVDWPMISALLPDEKTAMIAFCITYYGSIAFLLTKTHKIQQVDIPGFNQADLDQLLVRPDSHAPDGWIDAYLSGDQDRWCLTIERGLQQIGTKLLEPVLASLSPDIDKLILLPSGGLFLLPLHAAPLSAKDTKCLCDRYEISYAPSVKVLADCQAKGRRVGGQDLYAVINPQDDPNLVFTPYEGAIITRLFKGNATHHAGLRGQKSAVVAGAKGKAYLHFSCHGLYRWDNPLESGVALADGRLTLADLQSGTADLSAARLVTLSACETGIIDVMKGNAEEYVGLPAGFMLAGVPCVVSSLWKVWELSTAPLMEHFYRNHLQNGMGFAAALRQAQLRVRDMKAQEVAEYAEQCYEHVKRNRAETLRVCQSIDSRTLQVKCTKNQKVILKQTLESWNHYRNLAQENPTAQPFKHPYYWAAFTVNGM